MKKPVLLSLSAWMILGSVQLAQAQKAAPKKSATTPSRTESKTGTATANSAPNRATAPVAPTVSVEKETGQASGGATAGQTPRLNPIQTPSGTEPDPQVALAARAAGIRQLMSAAGLTDAPTQSAVIGFIYEQEKQRQPLLQLAREALAEINRTAATQEGGLTAVATNPNVALANANKEVIDDDPGLSKYQEYEMALEGDVARYNADLQKLDEQIQYSRKPRLEAFLKLLGVLDNDSYGFGGPAAIFLPDANSGTEQDNTANQATDAQK